MWIGCRKSLLFWRKNLSSTVNVVRNSPRISDITKRESFKLCFARVIEKHDKSAVLEISEVWTPLACWLLNNVRKRDFPDISVTKSFAVGNFGNT